MTSVVVITGVLCELLSFTSLQCRRKKIVKILLLTFFWVIVAAATLKVERVMEQDKSTKKLEFYERVNNACKKYGVVMRTRGFYVVVTCWGCVLYTFSK